jgi:hypothetical protein
MTHEDIWTRVCKWGGREVDMPQARLVTATCGGDAPPMPPSSVFGAICGYTFISSTNISMHVHLDPHKMFMCRRTPTQHVPLPLLGSCAYVSCCLTYISLIINVFINFFGSVILSCNSSTNLVCLAVSWPNLSTPLLTMMKAMESFFVRRTIEMNRDKGGGD